jgi:hypothetical protein
MSSNVRASRWVRLAAFGLLVLTIAVVQPTTAGAQVTGSKPAIFTFTDAMWYLRSSMTTGVATSTFRYGVPGDFPVMGDWDGDGDETVGVVRFTETPSGDLVYTWFLRNANSAGPASVTPFTFGVVRFVAVDQLGTIPIVGDWDGDGDDTVGVVVYDFSINGLIRWELRNTTTAGPPDIATNYGRGRAYPVVGDWDGNGSDTFGLFSDNRTWLLRNSNTPGTAQISFAYGSTQFLELPVVGDWDGNGTDTPAVLRNRPPTDDSGGFEHWLFRNSNSAGSASGQIIYGSDAQEISPPIDFVDRLSFR